MLAGGEDEQRSQHIPTGYDFCGVGDDLLRGLQQWSGLPHGQDLLWFPAPVQGTVTYGQPPISHPFGAAPDPSSYPCMQAPTTCSLVSFDAGSGAVTIRVTIGPFQNGQIVTLPSSNVRVTASFYDAVRRSIIPYDGGAWQRGSYFGFRHAHSHSLPQQLRRLILT